MERVQATAAATAAEETMALYDAFWFRRCVLLPSPMLAVDEEQPQPPAAISPSASPTPGLRHRRTRSDEATAFQQQGLEPLRIPNNNRARLETILSGKDCAVAAAPQQLRRSEARCRPARRRRRGRSMSELEFEELKGLQDLGFTFSDAEVDAELASIVPGLRRKRSQTPPRGAEGEEATVEPRRPYLSEAWADEEEQVGAMLRNWRIPAAGDGADMKQRLLVWAHTVASAVR
jgi:hypothetical protein